MSRFPDLTFDALVPVVSAIISGHAAFAADFDCANNARPYEATRVTQEYFDTIIFFRSWKS